MARSDGLDKMSYAELSDMELRIARLKTEKQDTERATLRQKVIDMVKQHGFDIRDLLGRKTGKGTVAPKYRDPKNRRTPGRVAAACRVG